MELIAVFVQHSYVADKSVIADSADAANSLHPRFSPLSGLHFPYTLVPAPILPSYGNIREDPPTRTSGRLQIGAADIDFITESLCVS